MHKILVIDDDPTGTGLLIDLLRFAGHQGTHWRIGKTLLTT